MDGATTQGKWGYKHDLKIRVKFLQPLSHPKSLTVSFSPSCAVYAWVNIKRAVIDMEEMRDRPNGCQIGEIGDPHTDTE